MFFSRSQAQKLIGCGANTATKLFHELSACGLIDDIPQGRKKAKAEKKTRAKKARETLKKLNTSIKVKTAVERKLDARIREKRRQFAINQATEITAETIAAIREQIEYQYFIQNAETLHITREWVDTIVLSMAEMETALTTKIGGCMVPWNVLKESLRYFDSSYLYAFIQHFR